jgi:hypothetical protein
MSANEYGMRAASSKRPARWIPITIFIAFFGTCVLVGIATGDSDHMSLATLRPNYLAALATLLITAATIFAIWYSRHRQT